MTCTKKLRASVDVRVNGILRDVALAFGMDAEERSRFEAKPIARLIAALPFLAECERPERTAIEHLGTYALSVRETRYAFYAQREDDGSVYDRLRPIMRFVGGNEQIIGRGMALLALSMIIDYQRDALIDAPLGKHNPVASGAWDGPRLEAELRARVRETACPQMDEILDEGGTDTYWAW